MSGISHTESDEHRRKDSDVVWSDVRQSLVCIHCGQLAIELAGVITCQNDPECLQALQEEGEEERDCAPEGYSYAVFGSDQ